jgi:tungstate transport system ATP-binding protein
MPFREERGCNAVLYELKNLKKIYDQRTVLDLDRLCLEKNRILALLGPNGAGKTTLLEILAFLAKPNTGDVWFDCEKVNFTLGNLMALRKKVVLVQQQPVLFSTTVFKNVEFPLKIRNTPKAKRERIVEELLSLVGMEAFSHAIAHKLSGGETQRVAIARALACGPKVILMDEPTASVDVENQITIERIIREINREKRISVILTTHNLIQASRLADETVFLYEGRVAQSIYENIFSGQIEVDEKGDQYCRLQNGLKLRIHSQKIGPTRISIDPNTLLVSKGTGDFPEDNTFKGKLIQLSSEQGRVRALVDVGIPLSVLIQKDKFKGLQLSVDENVYLTCPDESIEVF